MKAFFLKGRPTLQGHYLENKMMFFSGKIYIIGIYVYTLQSLGHYLLWLLGIQEIVGFLYV